MLYVISYDFHISAQDRFCVNTFLCDVMMFVGCHFSVCGMFIIVWRLNSSRSGQQWLWSSENKSCNHKPSSEDQSNNGTYKAGTKCPSRLAWFYVTVISVDHIHWYKIMVFLGCCFIFKIRIVLFMAVFSLWSKLKSDVELK